MKGFVRKVDCFGRVVLPVEWRRAQHVGQGEFLEIVPATDGSLRLQRYVPAGACTFCGGLEQTVHFAGRVVCRTCADQLGASTGQGQGTASVP